MDFFAHQDAARRASRRLIWVMVLAVLAVVAAVNLAFLAAFGLGPFIEPDLFGPEGPMPQNVWPIVGWITLGTVVVILGGGLISWIGLRGGGRAVAESLGGREVLHGNADADGRRLLNVVEEMAIASGVPCPPVYVLADDGINAFAAGFRPADAAIGVTSGLMRLPRDEVQGVIAHEYSHILNGDMRLNMRLIAAVAGLLTVAGIGRVVLRSAMYSGGGNRDKKGSPLPLILFGAALFGIGIAGWFIGRWIQAAFSRRREFLADASAVQFTRNPAGIAGALKRIAGGGSGVTAERAGDVAHLFFADAILKRMSGLLATHPPLQERIARLGGATVPAGTTAVQPAVQGRVDAMGFAGPQAVSQIVAQAGAVSPDQLRIGAALLDRLPPVLVAAAREPVTARALCLLPLLHSDPIACERQVGTVRARDAWLSGEMLRLLPAWRSLEADRARWPLIQLACPALAALSPQQRKAQLALAETLAAEDGVVTLREFCVLRVLRRLLGERRPQGQRCRLRDGHGEASVILGAIAQCAANDSARQDTAYAAGWSRLPIPGSAPSRPSASVCDAMIGAALDRMAGLDAAGLRALIDACAHAAGADGVIQPREAELLQLVAAELGVPLPCPDA